jgi:hypothetical protein
VWAASVSEKAKAKAKAKVQAEPERATLARRSLRTIRRIPSK